MPNDNIFSGLKVVDFASFIAGPSAAVILSDFGADVIKVESPAGDLWRIGHKSPPQPQAKDAYPWHLANRNKRGITLDLKSPSASQVLEKHVGPFDELLEHLRRHESQAVWETAERIMVAVTAAPGTDALLRRAARIASCDWSST